VNPLVPASAAALWTGSTLLLSGRRWFARQPLVDRLAPYHAGFDGRHSRPWPVSVTSFVDVAGPVARAIGEKVARATGVTEELELRLRRLHLSVDVTAFRLRQLGWSVVGFGCGAVLGLATRAPAPLALLFLVAGPALGFLLLEQRLAAASDAWRARLQLELPVICEQLAMLLSAGYSLGGALRRIASRGQGCAATDVRRVCQRVGQGVSEIDALREWAAIARVDGLDRVVAVLALSNEASDLGRLLSDEARAMRKDVQRHVLETIDRRAQQVWIPVTIAALVPGVIFLAVPFVDALRIYATNS
jgi:Flp pilus assembly protein TadB